jgi:hypothetical protein
MQNATLTFGIPIEDVFAEVERSNWTKIDTDDVPVNASGKIVAGPAFSPPDLRPDPGGARLGTGCIVEVGDPGASPNPDLDFGAPIVNPSVPSPRRGG